MFSELSKKNDFFWILGISFVIDISVEFAARIVEYLLWIAFFFKIVSMDIPKSMYCNGVSVVKGLICPYQKTAYADKCRL